MRYIVQAAWAEADGSVELPDDARVLNVFYHPLTGALGVAVLAEMPPVPQEEEAPAEGGEVGEE